MNKNELFSALQKEILKFNQVVATEDGDWIVKGFIDIYKNIYTITIDTKVVSKVIEILLIPEFERFAKENNLELVLPPQQNFYPDLSFVCRETGKKFAVDIKSTFKDSSDKIKSMTLGAFTGYFRNRKSTKNTTFPYQDYDSHLVLGVLYTQVDDSSNEKEVYNLDELDKIKSVIGNFQFFVQPKYKIASASPGSGNTKNIGAITNLEKLINGQGIFSELGEEVYDDYWTFYLTKDMAKALEISRPYMNLKSYFEYKSKGVDILLSHKDEILQLNEEEIKEDLEDDEE